MELVFSRPASNVVAILIAVCLLPSLLYIFALLKAAETVVFDRHLAFWQRELACLAILFFLLLLAYFLIHVCRFTSYRLSSEGLSYIGFFGTRHYSWQNIQGVARATRKEEYSVTQKTWYGLSLARLILKDGSEVDLSVGGISNSDELFKAIRHMIAATKEQRDKYINDNGAKPKRPFSKAFMMSFALIPLLGILATVAIHRDASKAGKVGPVASALRALELGEFKKAQELLAKPSNKLSLDPFGLFVARMLEIRLLLAKDELATAISELSKIENEQKKVSSAREWPYGQLNTLRYMSIGLEYAQRRNYEKGREYLQGSAVENARGYQHFYLARTLLREGKEAEGLASLQAVAKNTKVLPEVRRAALSLYEATKNGNCPIKVVPGLTKAEVLKARLAHIEQTLEIIKATVNNYDPAPDLGKNISDLLHSKAQHIDYIYSPKSPTYGVTLKGQDKVFFAAVKHLVEKNLGKLTTKLFSQTVTEEASIAFTQLVSGTPKYRISVEASTDQAQEILERIGKQSLLPTLENEEAIEAFHLVEVDGKPMISLSVGTKRSANSIPEAERGNIRNSMGFVTMEKLADNSLWLSYSDYGFNLIKWNKEQGLPSESKEKLSKLIGATIAKVEWKSGSLKSTVLFYEGKKITDIDYTKPVTNDD